MNQTAPAPSISRRTLIIIALLAAATITLRHALVLRTPFDRSIEASDFADAAVPATKTWARAGFVATRAEPSWAHLDSRPEFSVGERRTPPAWHWLAFVSTRLFGFTEIAYRFPTLLCVALAAAFFVMFVERSNRLSVTLFAALLFISMPASFFTVQSAERDAAVLCTVLAVMALLPRRKAEQPNARSGMLASCSALLFGMFIDLRVSFVIPALLLSELMRAKEERRLGDVLRMLVTMVAAIIMVTTCFALWDGSVASASSSMATMIAGVTRMPALTSWDAVWWREQFRLLARDLSLPGLLCALAALPWLIVRALTRRDDLARTACVVLVPGLLCFITSGERTGATANAALMLLPGAALGAVALLEAAIVVRGAAALLLVAVIGTAAFRVFDLYRSPMALAWLPLLFLAAAAIWSSNKSKKHLPAVLVFAIATSGVIESIEIWRTRYSSPDARTTADSFTGLFESFFGVAPNEKDLFIRIDKFGPELLYFPFQTISCIDDPAVIVRIAMLHRDGRSGLRNVVILCPGEILAVRPDLAVLLPTLGSMRLYDRMNVVVIT